MQFGNFQIDAVEDGRFGLDGGAMFGIVPRPLWSRKAPPDEANRIELALRCLLVRGEGRVILIDNGMGEQWDEKGRQQFALSRKPIPGLEASLAAKGVHRHDVTDMFFTHLHFDHAGGTVQPDGSLTFPNAMHHLQASNWHLAHHPSPKDAGSFRPCDRAGLVAGENLTLYDGPWQLTEGFDVLLSDGHTTGMQLPRIRAGGETFVYCADLIPTSAHVHLPWVMGYDRSPVETTAEKQAVLEEAVAKGWILVFEHDPGMDACRVIQDERGRFRPGEVVDLGGHGRTWPEAQVP
ncbi:MAG: MBL fold metallo-hydrolase [Myxococcales bacterium]|nr:MBL fold metallo-hydrolase [Myxococcales bacterium]